MIRGLYTAASGMISNMVATDVMADNIANVNTNGYKSSNVNFQSFPEMLIQRIDGQGKQNVGTVMTGNKVRSTAFDFDQGRLTKTGNQWDLALEGDGFFTVRDQDDNLLYTRDGSFHVNEKGFVVTREGHRLQGRLGDILIPTDQKIYVAEDASVSWDAAGLDVLKIATFENNHKLEKYGMGYYKETPASVKDPDYGPNDDRPFKIHQNMLEGSNVNIISEMVNNITGLRLYEALQKNIQMHNTMLEKAVNQVGRHNA